MLNFYLSEFGIHVDAYLSLEKDQVFGAIILSHKIIIFGRIQFPPHKLSLIKNKKKVKRFWTSYANGGRKSP